LQYIAADSAVRGHFLSPAGKAHAAKIAAAGGTFDPIEMFSGSIDTWRRYASEDLMRWWAENGRMTLTQFKAQIAGTRKDKAAATREKLRSNAKDFV
jgi:hypothetical protein